jgi:hypothetical protein
MRTATLVTARRWGFFRSGSGRPAMGLASAGPARRIRLAGVALATVVLAPVSIAAQAAPTPPPARPPAAASAIPQPTVGPPVQRIESASAISKEPLGAITDVFELADGRVLVNDGTRRRLLLMDTTLTVVDVVLDSLSEIHNTYGTRPGGLLPYRGDSILFVDPASFAMVVLDPQARFIRVRSVWRAEHVTYVTSTTTLYGWPGLDAQGRIVHRIPARPAPPAVRPPAGIPYIAPTPDTAFVVAVDLSTRKLDTLGVVRSTSSEPRIRMLENGSFTIETVFNPYQTVDDWSVLNDGTVAFVRGREYRIDYLNPDGSWSSSERLPYPWERLTDEDKVREVDSIKTSMQRAAENTYVTNMVRWVNFYGQAYPEGFTVPAGYVPPAGFARDWMLPPGVQLPATYIYACREGETSQPVAPPPAAPGAPTGPARPSCAPPSPLTPSATRPTIRTPAVVPPSDLPDYKPPFNTGAVRSDRDGNLWVRTNQFRPTPGQGVIYDIVSRAGQLVNRIQLPATYTLVGFGRDKVVYLSVRDAQGLHLARVRLR